MKLECSVDELIELVDSLACDCSPDDLEDGADLPSLMIAVDVDAECTEDLITPIHVGNKCIRTLGLYMVAEGEQAFKIWVVKK